MQIKKDMWYWHELLELCGKYKRIYVSGPQRSGTRYTTYALAKELKGYTPIYSGKYRGDLQSVRQGVGESLALDALIFQSPHETPRLHILEDVPYNRPTVGYSNGYDNCLVIWMDRNPEDVIKSENRIGWHEKCFAKEEVQKYTNMFSVENTKKIIKKFDRNWYMKTWVWNNIQKDLMKVDYLELPYETLIQTDGYVPKEQRVGFAKDQVAKAGGTS